MLPQMTVAAILASCFVIFIGANLYNLMKSSGSKKGIESRAEVEMPIGPAFISAAFGTLAFFAETIMYAFLVFAGLGAVLAESPLQLHFAYDSMVQALGMLVTVFGYFLFIWSVLARGRYATSWAMMENQKLVTWGPYRYVRHPSYLAYFILFSGLSLTMLNLVTVVPLAAIPGYVQITYVEEELLTKRFGEAYVQYQQTAGRLFPRLTSKHESKSSKL